MLEELFRENLRKKYGWDESEIDLLFSKLIIPKWRLNKVSLDSSRVAFLPVRPDWNEPRKMWGYYNPLTGLFYPTDGLRVLLNAFRDFVEKKNEARKHFIILDEMNLARVEYYMSDLLSLMENMCSAEKDKISIGETAMIHPLSKCVLSRLPENYKDKYSKYIKKENDEIKWVIEGEKLCQENCSQCPYMALKEGSKEQESVDKSMEEFINAFEPIPPRIAYPPNLVIIGTVNVDETTFSFAPKVLDRAFVCEFNEVHVDEYLKEYEDDFEKMEEEDLDTFKNFVRTLEEILKPANLHFGYRVIKEMGDFLQQSGVNDNSLDFLLKSKVLPKIHGTGELVEKILKKLFIYCKDKELVEDEKLDEELKKLAGDEEWTLIEIKSESKDEEKEKSEGEDKKKEFKLKDSAKKIQEMFKRYKATGYVSFF